MVVESGNGEILDVPFDCSGHDRRSTRWRAKCAFVDRLECSYNHNSTRGLCNRTVSVLNVGDDSDCGAGFSFRASSALVARGRQRQRQRHRIK